MPSICSCLSKTLRTVDLFPTSNLLRYKGDPEYTTATGGVVSISVITIFIILFASMGYKTMRKSIIHSSTNTEFQNEPLPLTVTTSPEGGFMFAVTIWGVNLTESYKYFDVDIVQETYKGINNRVSSNTIKMVPCTPQHFSFGEELAKTYDNFNLSGSLCPPLGQQLHVRGKWESPIFEYFKIVISRCNSTLDPSCVDNSTFALIEETYQQFFVLLPLINTFINPGSEKYKSNYLDSRNYFFFSSSQGVSSQSSIQQSSIDTDISIMPNQEIFQQNITSLPDALRYTSFTPNSKVSPYLVELNFMKSMKKTTFSRSFNKIDTYFSYVGGLIGTIIGLIFILGKYNQTAYQISLSHKVFGKQDHPTTSKSFNFGYFLLIPLKKALDWLKCSPPWEKTQTFIDSCQEINMQLDISYILRKLHFLDAAISTLLDAEQLQALLMRQRPTIEKAKHLRRMHFAPQLYKGKHQNEDIQGPPLFQSTFSKQQIYPSDVSLQPNLSLEKQEDCSDWSSLSLSRRSSDIQRIEDSVKKVAKQSREGNKISRKIIQEMDEATLEQLKVATVRPDEDNMKNVFQKIGEEGQEKNKKEKGRKQRPKEEGFDFDYDLEPK